MFQTKNPNLGKIFEGPVMDVVGKFFGSFVYFRAIWYILWPFGMVCVNLVYFAHFGISNK
jgi:hypothetical protein